MLNLPNDIFAAVLARATPDDVCTYSHTCSAAAAAVRENRAGIVACRAPDFHGRERTLVALREFFPPGLHPDPEEALDVWPSIVEAQGSNVEEARFDFPSRGCSRVKLSSWPIRQTLDSIIVPAMNDAVALVRVEIGGQTIGTLTGAVIRALANGAPDPLFPFVIFLLVRRSRIGHAKRTGAEAPVPSPLRPPLEGSATPHEPDGSGGPAPR